MIKLTKTSILPNCQVPNSFFGIIYSSATHHTTLGKKTLLYYSCQLEIDHLTQQPTAKRNLSKDLSTLMTLFLHRCKIARFYISFIFYIIASYYSISKALYKCLKSMYIFQVVFTNPFGFFIYCINLPII